MRWEALFADMEAQLEAAQAAERVVEVADLTRAELAGVELGDRLRAALGAEVRISVAGGHVVAGQLLEVAAHWLLVAEGPRRALVPLAAVAAVRGLPARSAPATGEVARRLGLGYALRALARDRVAVRIVADGTELAGRIERVGADHLDLATGVDGGTGAAQLWAVPFVSIRVVRSD
ncbi:hypothetical protein [Pengzhenrongella frigida]|uniref:Fis family transcriptional regulator n=1 Tax=Pengzhenrongella frigida TaxID=1259133 RepID=A0A4Q5MX48_9MICO|nr:hypothetical protein [Cellulomonas sp. HLT2-17]RYV50176.1 hypothetical protein EUA98_15020 [Cellulomonas sp. HLT2-17]